MTSVLEAKNLGLKYPGAERAVFSSFNFSLAQGETVALCGESGSGKSSLLLCACGVIPQGIAAEMFGEIKLFGRSPSEYTPAERAQNVGMVFQNPETQLFCGTLELEVAFALENLCVPQDEMRKRVRQALETTGLWERRSESPAKLSGGQKQLLALAAVLALKPKLLLLDEALSQLDAVSSSHMMEILRLLQDNGQTMLFVDHNEKRLEFAHRKVWL